VKQHAPAANASGTYMKNVNAKKLCRPILLIQKNWKNKQHIRPLASWHHLSKLGHFPHFPTGKAETSSYTEVKNKLITTTSDKKKKIGAPNCYRAQFW